MKWTSETPKKAGWYFFRTPAWDEANHGHIMAVVYVHKSRIHGLWSMARHPIYSKTKNDEVGMLIVDDADGERYFADAQWAGPIPEPEEPDGKVR